MSESCGSSADENAAWMLGQWFVASLLLPVHTSFEPPYEVGWGIQFFLLGAMNFPFIPIWWANPLFFWGLYCLAKGQYPQALYSASAASLLALSTFGLVIERYLQLQTFDGTFGPGFYIWLGCMIGLTVVSGARYRKTTRSRPRYGKLQLGEPFNLPATEGAIQDGKS